MQRAAIAVARQTTAEIGVRLGTIGIVGVIVYGLVYLTYLAAGWLRDYR